jgi:hypothetical protein
MSSVMARVFFQVGDDRKECRPSFHEFGLLRILGTNAQIDF